MNLKRSGLVLAAVCLASPAFAQTTDDPFAAPIAVSEGVLAVNVAEFATIPDAGTEPPRMMLLADEPGTRRLFVNDMRGPLYSVSYDGRAVAQYLDINAATWGVSVQSGGNERGFQSFAFHPQFSQAGAPGFGRLYTLTDTTNMDPPPDFRPAGATTNSHDMVLLEWTARTPTAATYDGGPPRELMRFEQPFANHNGGHLTFNPLAAAGAADFGLLYLGMADGGSGGDPLNLSQNRQSGFGKILRIDPLGSNSANGKYGIPASNPFARTPGTLPEIYAIGLRNPQRFAWDSKSGAMFVADIGQNIVEKVSLVTAGANLGWNRWEGSYAYVGREGVNLASPRSEAGITYPVVEYGQLDALLQRNSAATMGVIYRRTDIPRLTNLLIFGDQPSGEVFYVNADALPSGGQDPIRRILFNDRGASKTFLQLIQEKNVVQGRMPATRADMRFGEGRDGRIFLINKRDGIVRVIRPSP
jgi:hypothetical protein